MAQAMSTTAAVTIDQRPGRRSHFGLDLAGKRVHFVGIGGCGMSGLARLARQAHALCSGTDVADSDLVAGLRDAGIDVVLEQSTATVPAKCDLLVISAAICDHHPEVVEARRRRIKVLKYAQLLGALMRGRQGVAVAGTHGKSTTTSLLSHLLIAASLDPSVIVGAHCEQIGGGWRVGHAERPLVAEACEFDRSFHNLYPQHAIILNVEEDHLDVYSGLDEIVESFARFAANVQPSGSLLIEHEMEHRPAIAAAARCSVQTIGFARDADWRIQVQPARAAGGGSGLKVELQYRGQLVAAWMNPVPGRHMAYNAAAAAVTAHRLGAGWDQITGAVESFSGLDRRMQFLGMRQLDRPGSGCVTVVDDYGHHPTEIDATLRALRQHYDPARLVCVFQPHQHSRTRFLLDQFAASFSVADIVIVPHIYFVRDSELERQAVQAADLVDQLRRRAVQAMHLYPFGAIEEQLELIVRGGDLLVTMGAGDVWKVARGFLAGR